MTSDLEEDHPEPIMNSNNASYDSSDRSFYSAQQSIASDLSPQPPIKVSEADHEAENERESETPTPVLGDDNVEGHLDEVTNVEHVENGVENGENVSTLATRKAWSDRNYENFVAKQAIKGFL